MKKTILFVIVFAILIGGFVYFVPKGYFAGFMPGSEIDLESITLPPGFSIAVYAEVPGARSMTLSPEGTLYVGTRGEGSVYAIRDEDHDNKADLIVRIKEGMNMPNGVAYHEGSLYVAEVNRILRFDDIENSVTAKQIAEPEVVSDIFPKDAHHGWKFIAIGPDEKLYVPVGAPCNVCDEGEPYARITRMNLDGTDFEIFARGVRNTVGFDWQPETDELWFTDNGRDWFGDDFPPDELNKAPQAGMDFGFPYCHGIGLQDDEFTARTCDESIAPQQELGPHVAALGMRFYTGDMFPADYRNDIFIAEHGSWNRKVPVGYRITHIDMVNNASSGYSVFAEGWLQGEEAWGRPVDVLVMPDGALLVSDDKAGAIYRITYEG